MTPELVVEILRQALMMTLWLGAPLLMIGFLAGIVGQLDPDRDVDPGHRVQHDSPAGGVPVRDRAADAVDAAER